MPIRKFQESSAPPLGLLYQPFEQASTIWPRFRVETTSCLEVAPIQFTVVDYLFKTRVEGREFSLHFIELKIIGYQASVNICESRRFVLQKFLCHGTRGGNKSTFFLRDYEQF